MYIRTTGTSPKFTTLAQKCPINLEYMCRLSVVHHMVRQQCPYNIIGLYIGLIQYWGYMAFSEVSIWFFTCLFLAKKRQIMPKKKSHPLTLTDRIPFTLKWKNIKLFAFFYERMSNFIISIFLLSGLFWVYHRWSSLVPKWWGWIWERSR